MTVTLAEYERLEFNLVAALADLPPSKEALRPRALAVLEKLRAEKRELLARSPDVLRKGRRQTASSPRPADRSRISMQRHHRQQRQSRFSGL